MNLEHMFGPSLLVEVVDALRDDDHRASLLPQPGLTLCYSQMGCIGRLAQSLLPPVMVKLPDPRWVARESLWSCQILCVGRAGGGATSSCFRSKLQY